VLKEGLEEQTAVSSIHVEFVNNTAGTAAAGSSLYGGYWMTAKVWGCARM